MDKEEIKEDSIKIEVKNTDDDTSTWKKYTYEEVQQMIQETRLRCESTINSCGRSLETISSSMKQIAEARNGIDNFYTEFDKTMKNLCDRIASSFKSESLAFKSGEGNNFEDSKESTIQECFDLLKNKKKIVFLTGAGISYASGIPTFRGVGAANLFQKDGITYKNEEIATYSFMRTKPDLFWERNLEFVEGMKGKKYNLSHLRIQQVINFFKEQAIKQGKQDKEVILVTQNIDGLHCDAYNHLNSTKTEYLTQGNENYGLCPDVYEVHGSKNYLRCDNYECSEYDKRFLHPDKYNSYLDLVCNTCKKQARPHVLYFDESYDEKNYRIETLNNRIKDMDVIICIGTQLETGFAANTVSYAIKSNIPVIEISVTPVIQKGGLTLKGKAEQLVPALCDKLLQINQQNNSNIKIEKTKLNNSQKGIIVPKNIVSSSSSLDSTSVSSSSSSTQIKKLNNQNKPSIKQLPADNKNILKKPTTNNTIKSSVKAPIKIQSESNTSLNSKLVKPKTQLITKK